MVLSVCIPAYNYSVLPLVEELARQQWELKEAVEILVYDDASDTGWKVGNRPLRSRTGVRYTELPTNLGRARIRNRMAKDATGSHLLFLDADSRPGPDYLRTYLAARSSGVVVGGTRYAAVPPADPRFRLHWAYGRQRESIAPALRRPNDYTRFQSNNFMAPRQVMLEHPFPDVTGYGHEDTLWAQLLQPAGVGIAYLDNPVEHLGLEPTERFLHKQQQAVANLRELKRDHPQLRTRLTDFLARYPRLSRMAAHLPEGPLRYGLTRTYRLQLLDLLKIGWYLNPQPTTGYSRSIPSRP